MRFLGDMGVSRRVARHDSEPLTSAPAAARRRRSPGCRTA